ncbi:glutaredoxin 3 [Prochlorococcus marinus str. MU1404]|uniref:glutaredoxin 3 n=1 Tax=Prochlorococcus marinus TaxID=1219 RepID=UPI001ADBA8EB|nr:glutaredoxin 3 [Prochlorococcus marinus]MBO8229350.1 glutaredoxin 3 [Prochlorococcus marinus XMU1404]MBW3072433.1 glutaredoxin 3 [Prochlorococcus marinus str. MU1404]MCR8544466.1 glutaredoxin 3 [Prochlorococcus marinus CUG1432]
MSKVEIYTWQYCPFCIRAKSLLKKKNINFTEYKIDGDEDARSLMIERADGRRTLPQIFIDNEGIGGCDDLYTLENENKLDALIN